MGEQVTVRTTELPQYPAFNERESPDMANEWDEWIEGLEAMFYAMNLSDDKESYYKLYHYLGTTETETTG